MKTLPISPRTSAEFIDNSKGVVNKLHSYLRPDGMNAVIPASTSVSKTVKPVATNAYFNPATNIPSAIKPAGVGEKIDFRFG